MTSPLKIRSNRPTEKTGWGMRPRVDVSTLAAIHVQQGCNDFGRGGSCSICNPSPECTCRPSEQVGKPFGWHKAECPCSTTKAQKEAA